MDDPKREGVPSAWAPRAELVALAWALGSAAAAAAVMMALAGDRPGMVLLGIAAVALLAAAAHGTVVRPRLTADDQGVRIRTLTGTTRVAWPDVWLGLAFTRRWGREVHVLELETDHLMVFGWIELGTDPRDVHERLLALRALWAP